MPVYIIATNSIYMKASRKKISAHLPAELLKEACRLGKLNQTDALVMGLKSLIADLKRQRLVEGAGKFHFTFDADKARERSRL
jgi:hypothetical protein